MAKVTVLMAVCNAERFLAEALDSLLQQTIRDIQVVCVDDCSTDRSWQILSDYSHRDSRIEIIHLEENRGQAHARNIGLRQASGEYTCFLDSDDFMSEDALPRAVEVFERHPHTDSVLFDVCFCNEEGEVSDRYPMQPFEVMDGQEAFRKSLTWDVHGVYIVRSAIHRLYPYDESAISYSDDNTTRIHYLKSREVRLCAGVYYYRQHPASVTHRVSIRRFDYLKANASMKKQLLELNVPDGVLTAYENVRWLNVVGLYMFYCQHRKIFSGPERAYGLHEIRSAWKTIEPRRLHLKNRYKLGYIPMQSSWMLFRTQEELYFIARSIKERMVRCYEKYILAKMFFI